MRAACRRRRWSCRATTRLMWNGSLPSCAARRKTRRRPGASARSGARAGRPGAHPGRLGAAALEPGTDTGHRRRRRADLARLRRRRAARLLLADARTSESYVHGLLEDPTAKMLRVASHVTFSPGIGLVGRVWLLGVAEVVDVPAVGASSTYARQEAALNAGVRTAIMLYPWCRPRDAGRSESPLGRHRHLLRRTFGKGAGG